MLSVACYSAPGANEWFELKCTSLEGTQTHSTVARDIPMTRESSSGEAGQHPALQQHVRPCTRTEGTSAANSDVSWAKT